MARKIESKSNVKGIADLFWKAIKGSVTIESTFNQKYQGYGLLALEPTYNLYIIRRCFKLEWKYSFTRWVIFRMPINYW